MPKLATQGLLAVADIERAGRLLDELRRRLEISDRAG